MIEYNFEQKKRRIIPKILLISYDENGKKFIFNNRQIKAANIREAIKDYDLIISCTQDSVCGNEHFQHELKYICEQEKYSLISKADAIQSMSCFFSKEEVKNVKLRIYGNNNTLNKDYLKEISKSSTTNSEFYEARRTTNNQLINKFFVDYISYKRITENKNGVGVITYYIKIGRNTQTSIEKNLKKNYFQYVFCNYTGSLDENRISSAIEKISTSIEDIPLEIYMITKNGIKFRKIEGKKLNSSNLKNNSKFKKTNITENSMKITNTKLLKPQIQNKVNNE
jgi:hypothetical protein